MSVPASSARSDRSRSPACRSRRRSGRACASRCRSNRCTLPGQPNRSTFIKAHWGAIAATDLFTVEVVNPFGLVRYHVLFVIDIATRCVCIDGITSDPNGEWMKQVARNLTDMWDGFLLGKRYLIHDRDPLFIEAVRGLLRDSGVKPLRLPANSPNLNAYAERFVLSTRRECLDRFVPLNERHLRTAITEYVVHYHTERNHQGLGNELITPLPASPD